MSWASEDAAPGSGYGTIDLVAPTKGALTFVRQLDLGETVKDVRVLFDVVPGTTVVDVELHDSPFSRGAKVKLS